MTRGRHLEVPADGHDGAASTHMASSFSGLMAVVIVKPEDPLFKRGPMDGRSRRTPSRASLTTPHQRRQTLSAPSMSDDIGLARPSTAELASSLDRRGPSMSTNPNVPAAGGEAAIHAADLAVNQVNPIGEVEIRKAIPLARAPAVAVKARSESTGWQASNWLACLP